MPTRGKKNGRPAAPATLYARLGGHIALEARADGEIVACFGEQSIGLGKFSAEAAADAQALRTGLSLKALAFDGSVIDQEIHLLVQRLVRRGLLEYRLAHSRTGDEQVIIEPQAPDYWPRVPQLGAADVLVLSRFAYLRRRANEMVLESPRARALFKICDPAIASVLATLVSPQQVKRLHRGAGFPITGLLALLVDCQILFKIDAVGDQGLRLAEGDDNLMLWDFHDLVFHTRSTEGRHANPLGGLYPYVGVTPPLPAVRPLWTGQRIDLNKSEASSPALSPVAVLLRERHSVRDFDNGRPITLAELSQFLDCTARVQSTVDAPLDLGGGGPMLTYTVRPYPSGGGSYELELYLAVDRCEGLPRGFYHYDAGGHMLVAIDVPQQNLDAQLKAAQLAMGADVVPQIVVTIAARFGKVSWKYSSIAYALILKDVGVLMQTFYVMLADMGLGGCAIGTTNIDLFAKMTGLEFHVEGPVGQFALGRGLESAS